MFSSPHQQAEARDAGEGGGQGRAGQRELAEVADEHDGDHLDQVLQEEPDDERPGKVQLLLRLAHRQRQALLLLLLLASSYPVKKLFRGRRCAQQRLLHACLLLLCFTVTVSDKPRRQQWRSSRTDGTDHCWPCYILYGSTILLVVVWSTRSLFSSRKFLGLTTVVFSFVFGNYYSTIN